MKTAQYDTPASLRVSTTPQLCGPHAQPTKPPLQRARRANSSPRNAPASLASAS
jgi:hypothetical protein